MHPISANSSRSETLTSLDRADVQTSARAISVCCSKPGAPSQLNLQISWEQLDWQLSSLTQICDHFSPFLRQVHDLRISSNRSLSEKTDVDMQQWRDLMHAFGGMKDFHVGAHAKDILWALFSADNAPITGTTILPTLRSLRVDEYIPILGPLLEAKESFIASRRLSGCPVELYLGMLSNILEFRNSPTNERTSLVDPVVGLNRWLQCSPECNVARHFIWAMTQTGPNNQALHHATAKCRYNFQRSK